MEFADRLTVTFAEFALIFNTETGIEDDQTDANIERVYSSGWKTRHRSISFIDR